ncbi:MAG: prepilin-type N-terminal cleavage/methylation domain-containing protein [Actinomycetota bacterium]
MTFGNKHIGKAYRGKGQAGYTLPEVLVSAIIGVLLLTAVFGILQSVMSSYYVQNAQAEAQAEAQFTMMRLVKEIRQAEKPLLAISINPGSVETLAFKADLNNDGTSEAILYSYNGYLHKIVKQVNTTGVYDFTASPQETIASNIRNNYSQTLFTFYGTSLTTPLDPTNPSADIINKTKLIKIRVVIDKDVAKPPAPIDLTSEIKLRNFGY